MPNILAVEVANPSQILNAGAYGAGALVRVQSGATSTGAFADISGTGSTPTIAIVAGTNAYTAYDPNGGSTTWYRTRYENAGGTRLSDWQSVFQVGTGRLQAVSAETVRSYLGTDTNTAQYSDVTMDQNILAAQDYLEHRTGRWFIDRPTTTFTTTSHGRAQVYVPGFRTVSGVTLQGASLQANGSFWAIPDPLGTGIYTAIQTRAFTGSVRDTSRPWLANSEWFDRNLDSPYFPGNYGGGWSQSSLPNDVVVSGDGGYLTTNLPAGFIQAVIVLGAFYTQRPASILADVAITPAGGVLNYSQLPGEVVEFIRVWSLGEQAVAV